MSMQLRIVDSSSFIFETDLPPSSRNIHPSGILHAFRTTETANNIWSRRRQEHTFAWVENSLHVDAALKHLQDNDYDCTNGLSFIPYSTKRNWSLRYPHASPAMECNDDGKVTVYMNYRPHPNGLGELGEAPPLEYHPPTSMKNNGVDTKRKNKGKHMNLVQDKTLLPDAERDELHVEIYKYLVWLHGRMAEVKSNAGVEVSLDPLDQPDKGTANNVNIESDSDEKSKSDKEIAPETQQPAGDETTKELKDDTNKQHGKVSTGKRKRESRILQGVDMHELEKAVAHLKYSFAVIPNIELDEASENGDDSATKTENKVHEACNEGGGTTTAMTNKKVPFLEDALDEELAKRVEARKLQSKTRTSRRSRAQPKRSRADIMVSYEQTLNNLFTKQTQALDWDTGSIKITVATSTINDAPKTINLSETIGHRKNVPKEQNRSDQNCYWLQSHLNQNSDECRQKVIHPLFVRACHQAGFILHGKYDVRTQSIMFQCRMGVFHDEEYGRAFRASRPREVQNPDKPPIERSRRSQRPIKADDQHTCKVRFSLYWCEKRSRWFLPHMQRGNLHHCGHLHVDPNQLRIQSRFIQPRELIVAKDALDF